MYLQGLTPQTRCCPNTSTTHHQTEHTSDRCLTKVQPQPDQRQGPLPVTHHPSRSDHHHDHRHHQDPTGQNHYRPNTSPTHHQAGHTCGIHRPQSPSPSDQNPNQPPAGCHPSHSDHHHDHRHLQDPTSLLRSHPSTSPNHHQAMHMYGYYLY